MFDYCPWNGCTEEPIHSINATNSFLCRFRNMHWRSHITILRILFRKWQSKFNIFAIIIYWMIGLLGMIVCMLIAGALAYYASYGVQDLCLSIF